MNARRFLPLMTVAVAALFATGCMKPYLKVAPNTPDPRPSEALVSGFSVHHDDTHQEKSLLDAAVDAAQNAQLTDFGELATEMLKAALAERGYTATFDGPRTHRLDIIQIASNKTTAVLTGSWRHPDTSHWRPDALEGMFMKPMDVIGKIRVDGQKEFFVFADVSIRDYGLIMKEPYVVVRTSVWDQDGKKVLDLRGIGSGDSSFMWADRSPQNLQLALKRGFESLEAVEEQPL